MLMVKNWLSVPLGSQPWSVPHRTPIMTMSLLTPAQWAHREFAPVKLGDLRRTRRLVEMATHFAQCPTGKLAQAFPEWKDLKGAYRFLDHLEFGPEQIQEAHRQQTRHACQEPGEYLL